jgi:hypothetical protein
MKQLTILILTLSTTLCFSQKQYVFDYLIEYQHTFYKDSLTEKTISRYYLTNSKNNSYLAVITNLDSLNYQMDFKDENGLTFNVNFLKSDLNNAELINVTCEYIRKYSNPYKFRISEYDFFNLKDTLINGIEFARYQLTSIKPKQKKRKKLGTEIYIIDKNTTFHLPVLYVPTAYEEWKSKKNIPNGIFKERLLFDYDGNITIREKIIGYHNINKTIVIDKKCDGTQNE